MLSLSKSYFGMVLCDKHAPSENWGIGAFADRYEVDNITSITYSIYSVKLSTWMLFDCNTKLDS